MGNRACMEGSHIGSHQERSTMEFDIIMALGVLEDCSEPIEGLEQLRSSPGSFMVVGVPFERCGIGSVARIRLEAVMKFAPR